MYLQQNEHQDENKNVEDEEESNTNIYSTSKSDIDISTSTASSDFHDDSGVSETNQDLTNTEQNINSNTQSTGQVSQTL